jgi:uncharacterized protein YqeY
VSASALKERLRGDLKAAMQAKATGEVLLLRTLIAALDNAEAVPHTQPRDPADPRAFGMRKFGDPSGEVARREIDAASVDALLADEADARLAAAADYDRHGQSAEAARLRREVDVIARYRG